MSYDIPPSIIIIIYIAYPRTCQSHLLKEWYHKESYDISFLPSAQYFIQPIIKPKCRATTLQQIADIELAG